MFGFYWVLYQFYTRDIDILRPSPMSTIREGAQQQYYKNNMRITMPVLEEELKECVQGDSDDEETDNTPPRINHIRNFRPFNKINQGIRINDTSPNHKNHTCFQKESPERQISSTLNQSVILQKRHRILSTSYEPKRVVATRRYDQNNSRHKNGAQKFPQLTIQEKDSKRTSLNKNQIDSKNTNRNKNQYQISASPAFKDSTVNDSLEQWKIHHTINTLEKSYDIPPKKTSWRPYAPIRKERTGKPQLKSTLPRIQDPLEQQTHISYLKVPRIQETYGNILNRINSLQTGAAISDQFKDIKSNIKRLHDIAKCYPFEFSLELPISQLHQSLLTYINNIIKLPFSARQHHLTVDSTPDQIKNYILNYKPLTRGFDHLQNFVSATHAAEKHVALKKYKNCVYFGMLDSQGHKEGMGILIFFSKDGAFFEGQFAGDFKKQGVEYRADRTIYIGKYDKGVIEDDKGVLYNPESGAITYGCFREGVWLNNGVQINSEQGLVVRTFDINLFRSTKKPNDVFLGQLINGYQKSGFGLEFFENGDLYVGSYSKSQPQGYGEYFWNNRAVFRGQFKAGRREGFGKWFMEGGDSYEGGYLNDLKQGKGVYVWANGSKYEGSFSEDYRHGEGQMTLVEGGVLKGVWVRGVFQDPDKPKQTQLASNSNSIAEKARLMRESYLKHTRYSNYKTKSRSVAVDRMQRQQQY